MVGEIDLGQENWQVAFELLYTDEDKSKLFDAGLFKFTNFSAMWSRSFNLDEEIVKTDGMEFDLVELEKYL